MILITQEIERCPIGWRLRLLLPLQFYLPVRTPNAGTGVDEHVCFIVGGGEVVLLVAGLVLPYQCFGCGVIDVEDGGGLIWIWSTSRMEKPSRSTFRRNLSLVFTGIFAYFDRSPTCRRFRCIIFSNYYNLIIANPAIKSRTPPHPHPLSQRRMKLTIFFGCFV